MVFSWMTNLKLKFLYYSCSKSAGDYNQLGGPGSRLLAVDIRLDCSLQKNVVIAEET